MEIEIKDIDNKSLKEFTTALFALKGMMLDISEEKEIWLSSASQVVNSGNNIRSACEKFNEQVEKSTKHIEYVVAVEMRKVSKGLIEEISNNITSAIETKTNESLKKSNQLITDFEKKLNNSKKLSGKFSRLFLAATIATTMMGGFAGGFVVHYLFPKMDKEVISRLNRSVTFSDFMRMVDEREKQQAAHSSARR